MKKYILNLVQQELAEVERHLLTVSQSPNELLTQVSSHLIEAGGKRLRPALYLLCSKGAKTDKERIFVASALETIHMATLVHDDVIDVASTRRGVTTANIIWGNHVAVLSGDYLFSKAFSILAELEKPIYVKEVADLVFKLCEGEILQIKDNFRMDQTLDDYFLRIKKKTADFLAVSCQLGGVTANLAKEDVLKLEKYGHSLGMAFQITDDVLDFTATSEQLGKPVASDLRNGIITLPVHYALKHDKHGEEIFDILKNHKDGLSDEKINRCVEIVLDSEAIEYSYSIVSNFLKDAHQNIPNCLDVEVKNCLTAVADFIAVRKF